MRVLRFSLLMMASAGALVGCSTPANPDVTDAAPIDALDITTVDVADASDVTADASDVSDVVDAGGDDVTDATTDAAPTVSFIAMVHVTQLSQNCMPSVAPDPMTLTGSVDIQNTGGVALGPITANSGSIMDDTGAELAHFTIAPITIGTVVGGATGTAMFTKDASSLMPANGCGAVPCSMPVRVVVPISGPNVPAGSRAISAITIVSCSF